MSLSQYLRARARSDERVAPSEPVASLGALRHRLAKLPTELPLAISLCAAPLILRTILLLRHASARSPSDAHGYLSDITVSAIAAVVLSIALRRLSRRARIVTAGFAGLLWTLLHVGNYEHVSALGAPLQLTYAQYMRDGVFVAGSALSVSSFVLVACLLAVTVGGLTWSVRSEFRALSWQTRSIVLLSLGFANSTWPRNARSLAWRERNFMELWLTPSNANASNSSRRNALPLAFRTNVQGDVGGSLRVSPAKGRPNVLLVILEGISGANIPSISTLHGISQRADMPELSAIAQGGISFSTFIANQRQTNRGEFALLCGRLDYLQSGTSRMTEYARDGGEACLPRILADSGYETLYLQPAPLSFMMKDQFMAKAGFSVSRGHDYFTKAYARSSWGVDDKAFFEQAAAAVEQLDKAGGPWFATLLTVGTHHPYTVPPNYRTGTEIDGDPHGLAIRYLDGAIGSFVAQLEAARLLEDTLLIITSDESFGAAGYDDVTQLLSYNWGFLIAKVPGEQPRAVTQHYAQTDVALSIADYVGVSTAPFVGRSLFREYQEPRALVFANTYQQKMYWAAGREIVECDEALSVCQKHVAEGPGLFSPTRASGAASDADIAPLREMLALASARQSVTTNGRTPLILDNAAVWEVGPKSESFAFGGQYFTLKADQEVVVSLDATLVGRGAAVLLDSDVYANIWQYELLPPVMYDGDSVRFEYVFAPGKDLGNVEVRLNPRRIGESTSHLILRKADMVVRPRTLPKAGGETNFFELTRARPMQELFVGSGISADSARHAFSMKDCVAQRDGRQLVATECAPGALLFGPYASAPAGHSIRATFEVASERGAASLRGELVTAAGATTLALGPIVELPSRSWPDAGFSQTITLTARTEKPIDGVEARLGLMYSEPGATLIIRRASLEVFADP